MQGRDASNARGAGHQRPPSASVQRARSGMGRISPERKLLAGLLLQAGCSYDDIIWRTGPAGWFPMVEKNMLPLLYFR